MKIKIQDKCRTVNGKPVKTGDIVDTDANTARNLILKQVATATDDEAQKLDLTVRSRLPEWQAKEQIAAIVAQREVEKARLAAQPRARA